MDAHTHSRTVAGSRAGSYPSFDWLRFVLASLVVLDHSGWHLGLSGLAVQTFFALSGWLIGGILLQTERSGLHRFFFNRGTRIWIPYVFAVGALYSLAALRDGFTNGYFTYLIHDLTLTHNWFVNSSEEQIRMPLHGTGAHFWTISVEEQFYLAAPLLMVTFGWGKRLTPWLLIAAVGCASAWWGFQYLSIVFGVVAAILHRDYGDWHTSESARIILLLLAATTLTIMLTSGFLVGTVYSLLAPIFSISVVLLAAIEGQRSKLGELFGAISYPLYLNHWIGIFAANFVANRIGVPDAIRSTLAYVGAVAVAYAAYMFVDRPVMNNRKQFYTPTRGKAFMLTAYTLCATGMVIGLAV